MKLLALDPSYTCTGYAVIERDVSTDMILLKDHGTVRIAKQPYAGIKLLTLYLELQDKIAEYGIDTMAIETPFMGKYSDAFMKLSYVRGILLLLAEMTSLDVYEYAPRLVKKTVCGYGYADKDAVAQSIKSLFPSFQIPETNRDVTDAIAVGMCCMRLEKW